MNNEHYQDERGYRGVTNPNGKVTVKKPNVCCVCSAECFFIGLKNSRGQYKEYCCKCYKEIDTYFHTRLWCERCKINIMKDLKMKELNRLYVPISEVILILEQSMSPKNVHIQIQNLIKISKRCKK